MLPLVLSLVLCGCNREHTSQTEPTEIEKIYQMYVANSDSPLTYEEWLASIKGDKGDKGDSVDITVSDDGYLVINGIKTNYKIYEENEYETPAFSLKSWNGDYVGAYSDNNNNPFGYYNNRLTMNIQTQNHWSKWMNKFANIEYINSNNQPIEDFTNKGFSLEADVEFKYGSTQHTRAGIMLKTSDLDYILFHVQANSFNIYHTDNLDRTEWVPVGNFDNLTEEEKNSKIEVAPQHLKVNVLSSGLIEYFANGKKIYEHDAGTFKGGKIGFFSYANLYSSFSNIKLELGDHPTTIYNGSNGNVNNSFTMNDNLPNVTNKKAKVILVAGQSNASGTTHMEYLKAKTTEQIFKWVF